MRSTAVCFDGLDGLVAALQTGVCDEAAALRLYGLGPEAAKLALLAAARRIAEQAARIAEQAARIAEQAARIAELPMRPAGDPSATTPATPSGMIPVYAKPNAAAARGRCRKRPGGRDGHPGHRRPPPLRVGRRVEHRAACCPDCGGALQRGRRTRTRITEDLPENIPPVVTEHTIHRDYCPQCRKDVEPKVPDAMPNATLGHRLVSFASWCHYGLGVTIDQRIDILQFHLQTRLSAGGLLAAWQRLAEIVTPWYEQIAAEARRSAYLHADETGWRVQGQTCWLWCFANGQVCYYLIDRCRGSPVLQRFFGDAFDGILLHDFWSAYESIDVGDRQYCLVHLLRDLEKVDEQRAAAPRTSDDDWHAFAKTLRRLIRDGIRLRKRPDFTPQTYQSRILRLGRRLDALIAAGADVAGVPGSPAARAQAQGAVYPPGSPGARAAAECCLPAKVFADADVRRLCKRLPRTGDHLFTFLDYPHIPFENNFAERMIRPAVILRKNSQSNRSEQGAATQAILMSVYRTLKLRGHDPLQTLETTLRTYVQTGQLPTLPEKIAANRGTVTYDQQANRGNREPVEKRFTREFRDEIAGEAGCHADGFCVGMPSRRTPR